jgi:hypothetical protein
MGASDRYTMDEFIGRLNECPTHGIDDLVSRLPESDRGTLAMFCYGRVHLHDVALAIAATCDVNALVLAGGQPGAFLFEQSRKAPEPDQLVPGTRRARISLATNASRRMLDEKIRAAVN